MTLYEREEKEIIWAANFRREITGSCEYCPAAWCCLQEGKPENEIDFFACGEQLITTDESEE